MRRRHGTPLLALLAFVACAAPAQAAPVLPADFVAENAAPGAGFTVPISMAFLPDGRFLVGEKRGRVFEVRNGVRQPSPLVAIDNEVLNANDRGLLSVAVDPNYFQNHFIYLLYTVDPDSNGSETNNDAFGRLTRYTVNFTDSASVIASSRTILMGVDWPHGPVSASPSHTVGALRWGSDGSLLVTCGDGAQFTGVDAGGQDAGAFGAGKTNPNEDIGAFRAQDITSLAGKVLRLNPANGHGYPSNPFATGDLTEPRSKVWCYGVRNSYRFCVRPGTGNADPAAGDPGTLYLGEVGWNNYEEMNVAPVGGLNFGWPCYEGVGPNSGYQSAAPAHNGCGSFGTATNPSQPTPPLSQWHHSNGGLSIPSGIIGNTATGGVFYTSNEYPAVYRQQYFYADYGQNWIRVGVVDNGNNLIQSLAFATGLEGPVDVTTNPVTGDVYYVSIVTSEVRRIRYTGPVGGNDPPVAFASANPLTGPAPLAVDFSSAGSFDPNDDPLEYQWLFADGSSSTAPNPSHVYLNPGIYSAQLTISDGQGGIDVEQVTITVTGGAGSFPGTGVLDDFNRPNGPIGGAWVDATTGLNVSGNALTQSATTNSTVWNGGVFGKNQEAFVTFTQSSLSSSEENLMLKVQGTSWSSGHLEIAYNATQGRVNVNSYAPGVGWVGHGNINGVTFGNGDQFGARADSTGMVTVYKNGILLGGVSVATWPYFAQGGRLGMTLTQINGSVLDDFGGGTTVLTFNTPPTAEIVTPLPNAFFYEGEEIALNGTGTDDQTPSGSLAYQWVVDLHHNNHVHPASESFTGPSATLIGENHDDGTGVFYRIFLIVSDPGGLSDTASVDAWPEVDLTPSFITTTPDPPLEGEPVQYRFAIRNLGRMPAPISHWSFLLDGVELASGDTLVAALDSVEVAIDAIAPAAGSYAMHARVDSLDAIFEVDEANNERTQGLGVVTAVNLPPVAAIALPADSSFFFAPETLRLVSASSDAEDPVEALTHHWTVTLRRAGGDSVLAMFDTDSAEVVTEDFEDGTGVRIEIALEIADTGGLADSAAITLFPERNLSPGPIATNAAHRAAGEPVEAGFAIHNLGHSRAPSTHWALLLDGILLAEGDVAVDGLDSARVQVAIPGGVAAGAHALRAVVDTLAALRETDESDNAGVLDFTAPGETTGTPSDPVRVLALSAARPNPSSGGVALTLDLPRRAAVRFDVIDAQGRLVATPAMRAFEAGRWRLAWDGLTAAGAPAPPGFYLARVRAGETVLRRRMVRIR